MKASRFVGTVAVLAALGAAGWYYFRADAGDAPAYRTALVERGDIEAAVSSTGTLSAVTTVQVGTQVSGQIAEIFVDFNDHVTKGQLVARIDPTLQEQAVREAQTGVDRATAELGRAQREYDRTAKLFADEMVTQSEMQDAEYRLNIAKASVQSAEISLDRAQRNLGYTSIYAPIDGIVVERNVDVGQTVAASLSAPQLFLIANDLRQLQILASVDESDIGMIREGQPVRFSVQTYPNEQFRGTVKQVRLQSRALENVVNYTVVVGVENVDGRLLPGMTATVDFLTGSAADVLMVPNAALRFRATPEMMAAAFREEEADDRDPQARADSESGSSAGGSDSATQGGAAGSSGSARGGAGSPARGGAAGRSGDGRSAGGNAADGATLWYLRDDGTPAMTYVRTGITDGQRTVVEAADIKEGMKVIVGLVQGIAAPTTSSTNPLQPQGRGRGRGGF